MEHVCQPAFQSRGDSHLQPPKSPGAYVGSSELSWTFIASPCIIKLFFSFLCQDSIPDHSYFAQWEQWKSGAWARAPKSSPPFIKGEQHGHMGMGARHARTLTPLEQGTRTREMGQLRYYMWSTNFLKPLSGIFRNATFSVPLVLIMRSGLIRLPNLANGGIELYWIWILCEQFVYISVSYTIFFSEAVMF